jgi:hypothetical protein
VKDKRDSKRRRRTHRGLARLLVNDLSRKNGLTTLRRIEAFRPREPGRVDSSFLDVGLGKQRWQTRLHPSSFVWVISEDLSLSLT